ncbi:MAG: terminase small subunit [Pseudomonadota bacterium]|nr:terminase small subunit [Pseudomonadota bacterium]
MNEEISVSELAQILGVTERRIQQLTKQGVISKAQRGLYPFTESVSSYIKFLKDNKKTGVEDGALEKERIRLTKAQAEQVELKNEQTRLEVAPVELFGALIGSVASQMAAVLDQIEPNVKRNVPEISAITLKSVKTEVVKAQNLAGETDEMVDKALNDYFKSLEK